MSTVIAATHAEETGAPKRGRRIEPQGVGGYDQSWYPICLSGELETGRLLSVEWMNGRVIALRDAEGRAHVLSAFCRHLGADLAGGTIIEDTVRCPYHHWRYDFGGQCVATAIDKAPPAAKLFRFPVYEGLGFVWAFNGTEPLFDPPALDVPEAQVHLLAEAMAVLPIDHGIAFSNSCDIQHLKAVHGMELEVNPEDMRVTAHSIEYVQDQVAPGLGRMRLHIHMTGSSALVLTNTTAGRTYLISGGRPLPGNRTLLYQAAAVPRRPDAPEDEAASRAVLAQLLAFGRQLIVEDTPIMDRVSFRQDVLTHSDRVLATYFDWVRAFPRSSVACDFIAP